MNNEDKLYWLKAIFALIAALVCSSTPILLGKWGIIASLLIYLATYPVGVYVLKVEPSKVGGWKKMLYSGLITYLFIFTAIWGTVFTLTYPWS
jgi:hypothetical protein